MNIMFNQIPNSPSSVIPSLNATIFNNFCDFIFSITQNTIPTEVDKKLSSFIEPTKFLTSFRDYMNMLIINVERNDRNGDYTMIYTIFIIMKLRQLDITINYYNIRRLLLMSFIITTKLLDDFAYENHDWAFITGLKVQEINLMEEQLMKLLDYNVFIREEHVNHIMKSIIF